MNSGWAVVLGAAIAFVGSIVGSLLAPLIQARIAERHADAEQAREQSERRDRELSEAIHEIGAAVVGYHLQQVMGKDAAQAEAFMRLQVAMTQWELLVTPEQVDLVLAVRMASSHVGMLGSKQTEAVGMVSGALVRELAAWRRGETTPEDVLKSVQASVRDHPRSQA